MKRFDLNDFIGGWFIGNFFPSILKTKDFEVSVKYYKAGDKDEEHVHLKADEYTLVISGKVKMNDKIFIEKDIIHVEKGEYVKFEALEETVNLIIKVPSVINDKIIK